MASFNELAQQRGITLQQKGGSFYGPKQEAESSFFDRAGTSLKERGQDFKQTWKQAAAGDISPVETALRTVGDVAGSASDVVMAAVEPAIKPVIEKVGQTKTGQAAFEMINAGEEKYNEWKSASETNERVGEVLESFVDIAELFPAAKAVGATKKGIQMGVKGAKTVTGTASDLFKKTGMASDLFKKTSKKVEGSKITQWGAEKIAGKPSTQVATILKETPRTKFNKYIKIAEKHSQDTRAASGFENVGKEMSNATKQMKKQLSSIGDQKSRILAKAKTGLVEFTESPRRAILAMSKLEPSKITNDAIKKLKAIRTKVDADRVIDEIQDMIYSGTRTMTVAAGGRLEKQLRGILGKMNGELKQSLPKAYRTLNQDYADKVKAVDTLNRGLREVVEGVPIGGASLVKQFFSPYGTRTKELFKYIKKETGIDLAQEATLAKYAGELFDDPNVRSLLQGIPRTKAGIIDEIVRGVSEKTGTGQKARDVLREGQIRKAKKITQPDKKEISQRSLSATKQRDLEPFFTPTKSLKPPKPKVRTLESATKRSLPEKTTSQARLSEEAEYQRYLKGEEALARGEKIKSFDADYGPGVEDNFQEFEQILQSKKLNNPKAREKLLSEDVETFKKEAVRLKLLENKEEAGNLFFSQSTDSDTLFNEFVTRITTENPRLLAGTKIAEKLDLGKDKPLPSFD